MISPAAGATPAQPVTFDWSDVANATSYEIQVDDTSTISAPFRANQTVSVSQATISGLPAQTLWWRVRARNAAGVSVPFSVHAALHAAGGTGGGEPVRRVGEPRQRGRPGRRDRNRDPDRGGAHRAAPW